jgi:hypothetical protein
MFQSAGFSALRSVTLRQYAWATGQWLPRESPEVHFSAGPETGRPVTYFAELSEPVVILVAPE